MSQLRTVEEMLGKKIAAQRALVNKLLNLPPVFNEGDTRGLHSPYGFAEMKYRALQALEVEEPNYPKMVVPMLLEKNPDTVWLTITGGKEYLRCMLGDMVKEFLIEVELREDHCLMLPQVGSSNGRKGPQTTSTLFTKRG